MLERIQQAAIGLSAHASRSAGIKALRTLIVGGAAAVRSPINAVRMIKGMAETAARHQAEVSSWVEPQSLADGLGGPFDACDLRHWLVLAERAGVAHVPAREILRLTEDEMSMLSGDIAIPDRIATCRLRSGLAAAAAELATESGQDDAPEAAAPPADAPIDREALVDRLFDAMDEVPEGWMVRSNRCGGSELKTLAGMGIIGKFAPEVRFGADLEVGPGWVRQGNRRRVNVSDMRTVQAAAQGPGFMVFLARPWEVASRFIACEDPHRHGTPFAGKGAWPAEWRAIVEDGQVVAVASYYGWCDEATPETARTALRIRELAQKVADEAVRQRAFPRYPDYELVRGAAWIEADAELKAAMDGPFGREAVSCTIDFIETADGPKMLFIGSPANHAAKQAEGDEEGVFLARRAQVALQTAPGRPWGTALRLDEATVLARAPATDGRAASAGQRVDEAFAALERQQSAVTAALDDPRRASFDFHHRAPPLRTIDYADHPPSNAIRMPLVSLFADIAGYTAYVDDAIATGMVGQAVANLHVMRGEMNHVARDDFGGRKVRYVGDCLHAILAEGDARSTDAAASVRTGVLAAAGIHSSIELCRAMLPGASRLGIAVGLELGQTPIARLGLRGEASVRCASSRATCLSEESQSGCAAGQVAIGEAALAAADAHVRRLFDVPGRRIRNPGHAAALTVLAGASAAIPAAAAAAPHVLRPAPQEMRAYGR